MELQSVVASHRQSKQRQRQISSACSRLLDLLEMAALFDFTLQSLTI